MFRRFLPTCAAALAAFAPAVDARPAIAIADDPRGCPSPRAFAAALAAIFPDLAVESAGSAALPVELLDGSAGFAVHAGSAARAFADTAHDCDERARKAAVFVALVLAPPTVDLPPGPALIAHLASTPSPDRAAALRVELDVAGALEAAPGAAGSRAVAGGGELGLYAGGEHLGAAVALSGLSPAELALPQTRAQLTRVPLGVGLRARIRLGSLGLAVDGGALASLLIARGLDSMLDASSTRLELGARAQGRVEYWLGARTAVFATARADFIPTAYDLVLPTIGIVGSTPRWWLGGVLGVTVVAP